MKKHYDSTINKHKEELQSLRTQLESSTTQFVPPKSKEELEAWRKEYPDVYDMVETIAMDKATTRTADLENKYKDLQLQQEQIAKEKAEVELLKFILILMIFVKKMIFMNGLNNKILLFKVGCMKIHLTHS